MQNSLFRNGVDGAIAEKSQLVSHLSKLNCLTMRGEYWTFVQGQVCSGSKCNNWLVPKVESPTKIDLPIYKRARLPIPTIPTSPHDSPQVAPPEFLLSSTKPSYHDVIREAIRDSAGGSISRRVSTNRFAFRLPTK